ncbi:MAG TPA: sigma-70 family RNA polymerase sigma factor [Candidatus Sulfotelmatobacter sp.]|nr:sigma-70 family RNA polymerase sigma factor [Candidatus Sulfotelmatobacter sp.]
MNELTDQQLLRDYAERRSDATFTELVRRHVDLVYSAAFRMTGEAHSAQDVTQAVFVALAQSAAGLTHHPVLSGWLHTTARNLAAKQVRAAVRRQSREQEAVAMNELLSTPDASWEEIAPQLDAALGELSQADRDALLLRYFERKSAVEMAQILGITDETAQKRVTRAVEKLREFFSKRKITIGAGSLGVLITANAVQAAPVGLITTISTAVAAGAAVTTSTIITAATKTIAMTILQKTFVIAVAAVLAGAGIYEAKQAVQLGSQVQTLRQQQAPLKEQIQQLQREHDDATNRLAAMEAENARLRSRQDQIELLKLRGKVTQLENADNDPAKETAKLWAERVAQLKQHLATNSEAGIPELQYLTDQDWLDATRGKLDTEVDFRRALGLLRYSAENRFANMLEIALGKYLQANDKQFPTDLGQLQSYFDMPVDDSILQRWEIVSSNTIPNLGFGDQLITQKNAVDDMFDMRVGIGPNGFGSVDFLTTETQQLMIPLYRAYSAANNGKSFTDLAQLQPYATTPEQQAALQKLIQRTSLNQ